MAQNKGKRLIILTTLLILVVANGAADQEIKDGEKCGTIEALELYRSGVKLLTRPSAQDSVSSVHFIAHFDTTGGHAVTRVYAESVLAFAEYSWEKQVGGLGWAAPPPDGQGPDDRYDIYIRDVSYLGITIPEMPHNAPYPDGATSYIMVDIGLNWDLLRSTVTHEFNHASQFRYSLLEGDWWYENCATWMEDVCYDDVNDYIGYLSSNPNPLQSPEQPITDTTNLYEYAGCLWPMFLHEYHSINCPRLMWERIGQVPGQNTLSAIDSILREYNSDLEMALGRYAVWRYFTGDRADTVGHFSESNLWPTCSVLRTHTGPDSGDQGPNPPQGPGGTSYIEINTTPDYILINMFTSVSGAWLVWHIGYNPPIQNSPKYMMEPSPSTAAVLPTMLHNRFVLVPVVVDTANTGRYYSYSGSSWSQDPSPPADPELEVVQILSPQGDIPADTSLFPMVRLRNNATSTGTGAIYSSFYIGDYYGDYHLSGAGLAPGEERTDSFRNWTAVERGANHIARCVSASRADITRPNNTNNALITIPLTDVEVEEILAPRGVVGLNSPVVPRALIRNNGTSAAVNFTVTFRIGDYNSSTNLTLEPNQSTQAVFADWIPTEPGEITTKCTTQLTGDMRNVNNQLEGLVFVTDSGSGVAEPSYTQLLPEVFVWNNSSPNPFISQILIRYGLPKDCQVSLQVYNSSGALVRSLKAGAEKAGFHRVVWNGDDEKGRAVPKGIYFYRLEAGEFTATQKMVKVE